MNELKRIINFSKPYKKFYIFVFLCVILTTAINLVVPLIIRYLIDRVLPDKDLGKLSIVMMIMIGAYILKAFFAYAQNYIYGYIGDHISFDIRKVLIERVQRLPLSYLQYTSSSEIVSKIMNDVGMLRNIFTSTFINIISSSISLIVIFTMLLSINWQLTLINILLIPLFLFISIKSNKKIKENSKQTQEQSAYIMSKLYENVINQKIIRAYNGEEIFTNNVLLELKKLINLHLKGIKLSTSVNQLISILISVGPILVLWYGAKLVFIGSLTLGSLLAFYQYIGQIYSPINVYVSFNLSIQNTWGSMSRVIEFLDNTIEEERDGIVVRTLKGGISLKSISFSYNEDKHVLKNISMDIRPGEFVAIIGESGAGKSTICNILMRFFHINEGQIFFDEYNIDDMQKASLSENVGIVTQDTYLFNSTFEDNIRLGKFNATYDEVRRAAQLAQIDDYIMSLPEGYQSVVEERGENLSGGQKQRISLARVFLKNPPILILDEATSSLDLNTEKLIQHTLETLFKNSTRIVIAHRLSTIINSDRIIVVKDGEIKEEGTHEQLIRNKGLYHQLYLKQSIKHSPKIKERRKEVV